MSFRWRKLARLYIPAPFGRHPKLISHASNPLAIHLDGDVYRIFYSGRDEANHSSIGAVDLNILTHKIIKDHYYPFFEYGLPGTFYADGVSIGNCYSVNGVKYIVFMGWQLLDNSEYWRGTIGRLKLDSDFKLTLDSELPLLPFSVHDPISFSYPWVIGNATDGYSMWYGSTRSWDSGAGEMLHVINSAASDDGHHWVGNGLAIPYQLGVAQAFSRPCVIENGLREYEMWFSYRGDKSQTYRIGYAVADDNFKWQLMLDKNVIDVSESGWDSEMVEYPCVFNHKDETYMLYNGNGYGRTGFGLAIKEML